MLLVPVGAFVAVCPMFKRDPDGKRALLVPNIALVALLLAGFVPLFVGPGEEISGSLCTFGVGWTSTRVVSPQSELSLSKDNRPFQYRRRSPSNR